ncbi:tryptophan synthase subunit alpha [Lignipirellula cremea]|uniref:Tryptophan synthase alpha chain n=1 Tax=Lignipirellula cremea TaxID=2528010 RepID=A0A518E304_9BACT|nr:tryptophan synthase subunit alpha [Lignipirellula cremea]QDU98475.1 Tryptophan synthase alpha chain [Lignipirellula cremea]
MSQIDDLFTGLRSAGKKAFMPFVTAGDPDLEFTAALIQELARRGCHLFEVGAPYSDPIADGPVIQASYTRALAKGIRVPAILEMLGGLKDVSAPRVTMLSYAIIHRRGLEQFVIDAKAAGVSGAIVPDLLVEESEAFAEICQRHDFSLIQLVTPTTPRERAVRIAQLSTGFLYYVSVTGITGERTELPPSIVDNVGWLREQTDLPICIGFGVSQPEHVKMLAPVADGVIVGSAIVRQIAAAEERPRADVIQEIGDYAATLLAALND